MERTHILFGSSSSLLALPAMAKLHGISRQEQQTGTTGLKASQLCSCVAKLMNSSYINRLNKRKRTEQPCQMISQEH